MQTTLFVTLLLMLYPFTTRVSAECEGDSTNDDSRTLDHLFGKHDMVIEQSRPADITIDRKVKPPMTYKIHGVEGKDKDAIAQFLTQRMDQEVSPFPSEGKLQRIFAQGYSFWTVSTTPESWRATCDIYFYVESYKPNALYVCEVRALLRRTPKKGYEHFKGGEDERTISSPFGVFEHSIPYPIQCANDQAASCVSSPHPKPAVPAKKPAKPRRGFWSGALRRLQTYLKSAVKGLVPNSMQTKLSGVKKKAMSAAGSSFPRLKAFSRRYVRKQEV